MKKWFIALLFVFACIQVVAIKAAPPQTYIHLDYEVRDFVNEYYNLGDGLFDGAIGTWACSNKIQIPKNVGKLYFSAWHTQFALFYNNETYIGFYYEDIIVGDVKLPGAVDADKQILGTYNDLIHVLDVPTDATHILLQTCENPSSVGLELYMDPMPIDFSPTVKPLIYYPAPADAAANITFNLMPMLMIVVVIAGLAGGLMMLTKKSKR